MTANTLPKIRIALTFQVHSPELLRELAQRAIEENGGGHEYDPDDLADCLVETLLHSNPDIAGYMDYGVELLTTELGNEG